MTLPERPQRVDAEDLASKWGWDTVLKAAGFPDSMLHRRHQPCPMCGTGKDRFKFYDLQSGKNWCNVCGMANSGMRVLIAHLGTDFKGACAWVRGHFGHGQALAPVKGREYTRQSQDAPDPAALREKYRKAWTQAKVITPGTPAWEYLNKRAGAPLQEVPKTLRWTPSLDYWVEATEAELEVNPKQRFKKLGAYPALIAAVQGQDDRMVNLHRYYLTATGDAAPVPCAKKAAGPFLDRQPFAIRLGMPTEVMGIAEGLENALAEGMARGFPVWATVNANGMGKFDLPECVMHVKRIYVFGDNDAPDERGRRAGNEAAKALAARLRAHGKQVIEIMPASTRYDFADIRTRKAAALAA